MPTLKKLSKELRQEIVSYVFFSFPPINKNFAFRFAILIFAKTRFCSLMNLIGRYLLSKVIPKGFHSNFHASSLSHSNKYLRQIQCKILFHVTLWGLLLELCDKNVTNTASKFYNIALNCLKSVQLSYLAQSIRNKIQEVNSELFNHLHQIKTHKLEQLTGPPITCDSALKSLTTVVTTVVPKGFRSNFHASSLSHSNKYLRQIQCKNSFSHTIMRITIRAMWKSVQLSYLAHSIRNKIQEVNSKLSNHLHQINTPFTPTKHALLSQV